MSENTQSETRSWSGPTIVQAFIWGFMAAAFGTLFAFIGRLLSEKPELPPAADPLHGIATPAEMNRALDELLAAGATAIDHDTALASNLTIGIVALCALVIGCAAWVVLRRRRPMSPPTPVWRTVLLVLALGVPLIATTVTTSFMKDRLLHGSAISSALHNEDTRPPVVGTGTMVEVRIPTTLQSFFGYHESRSFRLKHAVATLSTGEQVPLNVNDARLRDGGRKPDMTDIIPLMENVDLRLQFTVPDDRNLRGAVVDVEVAGSLGLIPSGSKQPNARGDYDAAARFRVARDQESEFQASYEVLSSRITRNNWFAFPTAGLAILAITFLSPWFCRKCRARVSAFGIMDGHTCKNCFEEQRRNADLDVGAGAPADSTIEP